MKPVILFIDGGSYDFDTVKEAQNFAVEQNADKAEIFTLYSIGERPQITWNLQTDTATNLREIKKTTRSGKWTTREVHTAIDNYAAGKSIRDIATALNRSYNSVYLRVRKSRK